MRVIPKKTNVRLELFPGLEVIDVVVGGIGAALTVMLLMANIPGHYVAALIVAAVVSHNAARILETGAVVFAVVILHNLLGYAVGFLLGRILKLPLPKKKALSIEIGMQNSGLATSLAGTAFPDLAMATVPGAIFSVWHNVSGAVLANVFRRMK